MQVDEPGVWTELGHAQLDSGAVGDAIASYLKSGDSSRAPDVIARAQEAGANAELVKYLLMVRKKQKDAKVSGFPILAVQQRSAGCVGRSALCHSSSLL
jgi:clathrin heavy chain